MLRIIAKIALVVAVLLVSSIVWKREEIGRLLAVNSLFSEEKIINNFSNMDELFLTVALPTSGAMPTPLPATTEMELPAGSDEWIADRAITSLLVLKKGHIVHESYHLGTVSQDMRIGWSIAKSYVSTLIGILLHEGAISDIDEPVTKYVPALRDTAYNGRSIRSLLQMASGVEFNEDYSDYWSDINKMGRAIALGWSLDAIAGGIDAQAAAPGEKWHYNSFDTQVLGMVIRGATGRTVTELMAEKLIGPLGLESQPYYLTDGDGVAFVMGGLNMVARDYARFGQMVLNEGRVRDRQVVPSAWLAEATEPSAPTEKGSEQYGYQWWMPSDAKQGEFYARGLYGQYIYVDRASEVVIVVLSGNRQFRSQGVHKGNIRMFRRIATESEFTN